MNPRLETELEYVGDACLNAGLVRESFASELLKELDAASAKLSERKTIHEWLTSQKVPSEEMGNPICLLRRLRITMDRYRRYEDALHELIQATDCSSAQLTIIDEALEAHKDQADYRFADCLAVRPECRECGELMNYGQAIPAAMVDMDHGQRAEGAWDGVSPMVAVWKCPKCGHSFSKSNARAMTPATESDHGK